MLRRCVCSTPLARTAAAGARTYFYPNPGETGISGATMKTLLKITCSVILVQALAIRYFVFERYGTKNQYVQDCTDLWDDDGTVMEGEEAVANLRIQRERIMPFMNDIKEKLEAAGADTDLA
ncbi:uncharacterized protein TEOVI_000385200 [Trypanosoma equiperdum]|uniref:Uncharacterized protein n=4 Tax=Trypanozoon TaxID=39700 RepID=Q386L8_TRYB2|nr:hypothetical protein, conserved [Trypanosoma brucei gambiense DAL972]XP_828375.1 hypothetical protein, conserved [Trypanosoma brucei brucei TREU927]RHW68180.1 hypothetical protein DPX39_110035900 [Trypanosoma brucei equiperdum]SCU72276.1 hypothetical protein, conserved [Trypanosoma equiperdum]EAN79263.1 hypothetical protein, conserved [Trypanosoma brucei brucei TREU927]CBH17208.1 hypothetical protein, conserved [Trypanosoma brucei gambiense DAL972]|eukprot:XP_011779472.1 hypothetical protein, conserved [Trypanosoma brucei gambiense DAL972]